MKPLFVPLKTEYFRAFERGEKQEEYRVHGPRWNRTTCTPGRPAVLSHGYSGARLERVVHSTRLIRSDSDKFLMEFFGSGKEIIAIRMAPRI